jgi:beta-glucosidase
MPSFAGGARTRHKPAAPAVAVQAVPIYKNAAAPVAARVSDLIGRMTLEEKVVQLQAVWYGKANILDSNSLFDPRRAAQSYPNGIGQITRLSDNKGGELFRDARWRDPKETVELGNAIQHWAVEKTRLGIPVLFHEEGLHGYASTGATSFPQAIAQASSWDPALVREIDAVVAREIAVRGVRLVLSPVIDVARDPRWGRIEETFGEDPYLVGEMGVAAVAGLQGDALPLAEGKVFATLKHFTGHGQPESGTNVGPAEISERTLRENFFPPFEEAVTRTKVRALMPSYNEIDGVPSHRNAWLLQKILRGEWGYQGLVASDYDGIEDLVGLHHVAADYGQAALLALQAGVDIDLPDGVAYQTLAASVRAGKLAEKDVDAAVRRVLTLKFEAGLFEHPYADPDRAEAVSGNAEAAALALKAAERSVVLLKNDGALPLDIEQIRTLAVIGPNAAVARLGTYAGRPRYSVSVLDGVRARVLGEMKVVCAKGVQVTESRGRADEVVQLADPVANVGRISEAVALARTADQVILVLGDSELTSREATSTTRLGDRSDLTLPGQQMDLARAIFALGKPTVVVLLNGRPPALGEIADKADAILEGWYLGQEGGTAVAKILFGDVNPGGKLPVTLPRSVGQLPMFYNYKPSAHRGYLFDTVEPQYPFGWGLSYTTFEIGAPRLSKAAIKPDESVTVSVDVKNTGKRPGDEVVQLYIHQHVASVTRPVKELKGFKRITLAPGETGTVDFVLTPHSLETWNIAMKRVVEPGAFDILVGDNSVALKRVVLTVEPTGE